MKKQTYKIMATALIVCSLCISTFATFAGMNNQGGGGDYEFDVPVETEPTANKKITIDIIKTKIKISTSADADPSPDDDFEFQYEDVPVATPSDAIQKPEKPIKLNPKNPEPTPPKDDILNYPANIMTPPEPESGHIENQRVGTIEAYYEHSRPNSRLTYYIDEDGVLRVLPQTGDLGFDIALVIFTVSLASLIYLIHNYKHSKKKDKEESS